MAAASASSGAHTARGVAGEAANSQLRELIQKHGGHVPYYDVKGQQHYRVPFKDKSFNAGVQDRAEWRREPRHRTRTELLEARRAALRPDISYDVDGDGAVGPTDYFVGKTFGREQDHRLNSAEREQAVRSLESGWLDKYSFGHEQAGAKRAMAVKQFRGKIITADTVGEVSKVYPPHWNAGKMPRHPTTTDLKIHRKMELRECAEGLRDQWEAENPASILEPPAIQEFSVAEPPMTHISQRKEAFQSTARQEAGLDPAVSGVNPERETQEMGLGWRELPEFATRTALHEARKARLQEDLVATRTRGEQTAIPVQVSRTIRHHEEYEARRGDPQAMTLTKLTARRRQERIEHNMANFTQIPPEPARFSDQEKPWWTIRDGYCPDPPSSLLRELRDVPEKVAPKVTEVEPPRPRGVPAGPPAPASPTAPPPAGFPALSTGEPVKAAGRRWSSEFVPRGLDAQVPRLFDGVKQAPTLSTDSSPLHCFSSFEVIRKNAENEEAERHKQIAKEDEDRAVAWQEYVRSGPSSPPPVATSPRRDSLEQRVSVMSEARSRASSRVQVPRLSIGGQATKRLNSPLGEDPPMTERLELLGSKGAAARAEADTPKAENGRSASVLAGGRSRAGDSPTAARSARDRERAPSAATSAPSPPPPPPQLVVRTGGFQYLDRTRAAQRLVEEPSIPPSLRRTPQASVLRLPSEGSATSRAQSRNQASLRNLGSDGVLSRLQSRDPG